MLNNLKQIYLKLIQRDQFKNQEKQPVIPLVIKLQIKLEWSQEVHHRIIQKQLQKSMIKKYLKKDISLEERHKVINNLILI